MLARRMYEVLIFHRKVNGYILIAVITVTLGNFSCNMSLILFPHMLHESLPSVTCSEMNMCRNYFLLPPSLREVEVSGHVTPVNDPYNFVSQRRNEISRQVTRNEA